jgi:hypothetical protein
MTTKLRELLEDAKQQIDTYKHPNIDEFKPAMSEVLNAAGVGSLMRDCVESIDERTSNGQKWIVIETSWSSRGCSQTSEYRIPSFIVDSENPLKAAHKWKLEKAKRETEAKLFGVQNEVIRHATALAEINAQLEQA